jgi:hypothetical protein
VSGTQVAVPSEANLDHEHRKTPDACSDFWTFEQGYLCLYLTNYTSQTHFIDMSAEAGPSQTRSTAFSRWRDSVADLTGLGLSDNQKSEAAKAEAERQKMANDWDRCEEWKQKLMTQSKSTRSLLC